MRIYLTTLFILILLFSFGQSKYVKKSEKLFQKRKYEKCIERTKKSLKKERQSAELQYYIVASNFAIYKLTESKRKASKLKKTITNWQRLQRYNQSSLDFSQLESRIITAIKSELENEISNQRHSDDYHHQLAETFLDTSSYYRSLYQIQKEEINIDLGPVYENTQIENEYRRTLIEQANELIGVKYKYGGTDATGFDCSGFTQYLYKAIGIELPHNANLQSKMGKTISLEESKAGDLVFFGSNNRVYHAGVIYDNKDGEIELVHCASRGFKHQTNSDLNTIYWLEKVLVVKRFISNILE